MNLAICGNIVTAWSWFGTNLLGVGLLLRLYRQWLLLDDAIYCKPSVMLLGAIPFLAQPIRPKPSC